MQTTQKFSRMSIRVPSETHEKLKAIAKMEGRTLQSVLLEAVTLYIERESKRLGIVYDEV